MVALTVEQFSRCFRRLGLASTSKAVKDIQDLLLL